MPNIYSKKSVLVIAGPSGVGKGTLVNKLRDYFSANFGLSISHTSRQPREGEQNGVHYYFDYKENIENAVKEGKFLEHADVHGNIYGTSIAEVERIKKSGKIVILEVDVQGCALVNQCSVAKDCAFVFILPPSDSELEKRLRGRGTDSEDVIVKRLKNAQMEIEFSKTFDFNIKIVNDDLTKAFQDLKAFVIDACGLECPEPPIEQQENKNLNQ